MSMNPLLQDLSVAIVENQPMALTGLLHHLEQLGCQILWTARDDNEAREKAQTELPDVVFVDLLLYNDSSNYESGWQLVKDLRERGKGSDVSIIIFSGSPVVDEIVLEAVRLGTSYLIKEDLWEQEEALLTSVLLAARSRSVLLSKEVTGVLDMMMDNMQTADLLSPKELEVLALVAEGHSNQDIANKMFLTLATIKTHVSHILSKLEVDNRVQASDWYRQNYS
ncbi:MAG: response regulator transcription factor [Ardenticatenaceae bacterium]|nr:response regulator transcription factor [Ardenticatenaceae bacterium]